MFASIRRHQKWLWLVIIVLVIISFVIYFDPTYSSRSSRGSSSGRSGDFGYINDRALSREELVEAHQEVRLRFRVGTGRWPDEDEFSRQQFNADGQVHQRLILLEKLKELKVHVTDEAVADWIANVFRDREQGRFQLEAYQQFVQRVLAPKRYTEADFQRFVRHEVGIQHLIALGSVSGSFVTPREAEALLRKENEQLTAQAVLFPASNYLASVTITDAALEQFYTNNMSRYRTPEQVQVSYVRYDATNFLAEADQQLGQLTNLTALLQTEYQKRGPDAFKDKDGKVLSQEAAIEQMKQQDRTNLALIAGTKKATEFAQQLFDLYEKQTNQTDNLEKLAAALGIQSAVTEPFSRSEGPKDLKVLDSFTEVAFALTPEQPMASEPLPGEDAMFVIALKKRIPSEVQPFATVRDKAVEDYRRREALQAAHLAGQSLNAALTNGLTQGKTFEVICAEVKAVPINLPPFARSTRSLPELEGRVDLGLLKDLAGSLAPGKTSDFIPTRDGGVILHLLSRQPVDEARIKSELPAFLDRLRDERRREASSEWFRKEADITRLTGIPPFQKSGAADAN
ncbi:MAG TPA: SurA N-terminal domain-containing protein [Verrucomicrobiae bacterium]|nr:SurA N-terminal domain-containing protein [Verrucomicrobiae bacterium]